MNFKIDSLIPDALHIIHNKGTEHPFSGGYNELETVGTYLCRQCGLALFRSDSKFASSCGWPSFDETLAENVTQQPDIDGRRTEIICTRCDAHLGHVFLGEEYTDKDTRHCVNSLSLDFVLDTQVLDTEEAILAGGCFWGVEALFKDLDGVVKTEVGYTGGDEDNPSYEAVCSGNTGYVEAMRVLYDPTKINYAGIIKYFFNIHDSTQANGQGPDVGSQYLSVIFFYDDEQKSIAVQVIQELENKGLDIITSLQPVSMFWPAEEYHQDYYKKTGKSPYCHIYIDRFEQ